MGFGVGKLRGQSGHQGSFTNFRGTRFQRIKVLGHGFLSGGLR
jgi:hypothetical protein